LPEAAGWHSFNMSDSDAEKISLRIQDKHLLHGFIGETQFEKAGSDKIVGTVGNGDGALWTGVYLAAEAFHYAVTKSATAWNYLSEALHRVQDLATIVPDGFLVRTLFPTDADFVEQFVNDESHSGLYKVQYRGKECYYPGHPTRDQYAGVLFGLGVTYDLIDDPGVKTICRDTITHLVDRLIASNWTMTTPTPHFSESYNIRADQFLSVLQLARHVNPDKFTAVYDKAKFWRSIVAGIPLAGEILILRRRYFLLHLDHLYYYALVRYEEEPKYQNRYRRLFTTLRNATKKHGNAHFNMIDRALNGPDATRDAETVLLLQALLDRGFKDRFVFSGQGKLPVPVADRPYTDFMWQRDPFGLKTANTKTQEQESAGIDYILPYWMARYYQVLS
jgi:hypothetical protein